MFWNGSESILSHKVYPKDKYPYYCEDEGSLALLNTQYDLKALGASIPGSLLSPAYGMFRYMPFLPISPDAELPTHFVGGTPLIPVQDSKNPFNFQLWIKDEGRNPTASLKDRASSLACVKCKELGQTTITTASSGNAAAATSCAAANLGLKCVIFVPVFAPPAKILQNRLFGSKVYTVEGPYDNVVATCMDASKKFGWYNRSTGFNQFTIDGKKTVSFEICEQFYGIQHNTDLFSGKFEAPDVIAVSVGDGNIISGVHKGLKELFGAGLIDHVPRILGCQAKGSNSCYLHFHDKDKPETEIFTVPSTTCADSIACDTPNDPIRAVRAALETNGSYVQSTDEEILNAQIEMARCSGVFGEPAASTTWAGLKHAQELGLIKPGEKVVMICTGNGLKDIISATKAMEGKNPVIQIKSVDDII